jgi:hypothetical protein
MSRRLGARTTAKVVLSLLLAAVATIFLPLPEAGKAQDYRDPSIDLPADLTAADGPGPTQMGLAMHSRRSLGQLLREDDTIGLQTGFRGTLVVRGYPLVSAPDESPRF